MIEVPERALTLWQPWATAITHYGKRIENRPWAPWKSILGKRIALHAGKTFDGDGYQHIRHKLQIDIESAACPQGAIIGVIRVVKGVHEEDMFEREVIADRWFMGPWGWVIADDVVAFDKPIFCKGAQGLWPLSQEIRDVIKEQLHG